jgi:DNA-binding response OmpR family regulator
MQNVLVLEDEPLVAIMLTEWLVERGYKALGPVNTNEDALTLLAAFIPDAAILDVGIRDGFSYPVAQELERRKIPFAFATGYGDDEIDTAFAHVPVVSKPFEFEALSSLLCELIPTAPDAS